MSYKWQDVNNVTFGDNSVIFSLRLPVTFVALKFKRREKDNYIIHFIARIIVAMGSDNSGPFSG
jgi:hypothetical protein